jgi:hypothetical protein
MDASWRLVIAFLGPTAILFRDLSAVIEDLLARFFPVLAPATRFSTVSQTFKHAWNGNEKNSFANP